MRNRGRKKPSSDAICAGLNGTANGRASSRWAVMYPATSPETSAISSGVSGGVTIGSLRSLLRLPEPLPLLGDEAVDRVHVLDITKDGHVANAHAIPDSPIVAPP